MKDDDTECCPICDIAFKPDDMCANDITEGICHAACLEGAAIVNLETGDEVPEGSLIYTYRYDSLPVPLLKLRPLPAEAQAEIERQIISPPVSGDMGHAQ